MSPVEQLGPVLEFGGVVLVIRDDVVGRRHVDINGDAGTDLDPDRREERH
jgi:hypothetical protein